MGKKNNSQGTEKIKESSEIEVFVSEGFYEALRSNKVLFLNTEKNEYFTKKIKIIIPEKDEKQELKDRIALLEKELMIYKNERESL